MRTASPFARTLERVEREVYRDLYTRATPAEAEANRLICTTIEDATVFASGSTDVLFFNRVVGLGIDAPPDDATLDAVAAPFRQANVSRFFVQVHPTARETGLADRLTARGFRHHNNWMKLYRPLDRLPTARTHLRIEPIGPAQADRFARTVFPAFDWPAAVGPWLARQVGQPEWRHYLAFDGETVAAAAAFRVCGDAAYLGPAVTHPAFRRRGAQSALIARRLRDAADLGCRLAVTETAQPAPNHPAQSFYNMRRMGFEIAYARPNFLWRDRE